MRRALGIGLIALPVIGYLVVPFVFFSPAEQLKFVVMIAGVALAVGCIIGGIKLAGRK